MNWYNKKKEFAKKENKSCITITNGELVDKAFELQAERDDLAKKFKDYNINYK